MSISPYDIRRIILEQSKRAQVGHIGSGLSIADILAALYNDVLHIPAPDDPTRDRFVLSKGHAALALYAVLYLKGWISEADLNTFCGDDSLLGVHPEPALAGVDFATGSLGQGLSIGVGAALAARLDEATRQTYVLISDAECNEGSLWEAVMVAAQHQLENLTVILDMNGQQALDYTPEVLDLHNMAERWQAFGWHVQEVNGHDVPALQTALRAPTEGQPRFIIAQTVFGRGVSYMQSKIKWHYFPMSDEEYAQALQDIQDLRAAEENH